MRLAPPVLKDIVLLGAGHAHVSVLRMFGMQPVAGVRITLITRQVHTPYSGMLPGLVSGHYSFDEVHIDTGPLCALAGARLLQSEAMGLDLANRRVLCRDRPPVPYDLLSIDIGSTPSALDLPGVAQGAIPVKPIDQFLARFEAARQRILALQGKARIGIVGGGAAGIELALALQRRLRADARAAGFDPDGLQFALFTGAPTIVPALPPGARDRLTRIAGERGLRIHAGSRVTGIDGGQLRIDGGAAVELEAIFWTTQAAAASWLRATGLQLDADGFIVVDDALRSVSHPDVFAAGDVASMRNHALPKSGVYSVRQGGTLAVNLRRQVAGQPLRPFRPQRDALYLISTGERHAVGTRNGISFEGAWVWRWKDHIDRKFMALYNDPPVMRSAPELPPSGVADEAAVREISALAMRCGGCGAKVGATVLGQALQGIAPLRSDHIVVGLDAPDDAAVVDNGGPQLSVHTVDYFRAPIDDPYLFGKIAANHALGDIYAMGAAPQSALAIATLPYGREVKVADDLSALMQGANEVLRAAGCALVGGHTSEGAEMALGFAVNGLVRREALLTKAGLRPGDALLLTKPLGTGTVLAAHMRGRAKARWLMAALSHMCVSNARAAEILSRHGVHAATDVTGFGLLGHLIEMTRASQVDVRLDLAALPVLEGARETVAAGVLSSLQPQNIRLRRAIRNLEQAGGHPDFPLLFDPQTAGGLLAAVPAGRAAACIAELLDAGYAMSRVIGTVHTRTDAVEPVSVTLPPDRDAAA